MLSKTVAIVAIAKRIIKAGIFMSIVTLSLVLTYPAFPAFADTTYNLDRGAAVFKANCAGCHVKGGNIVRRGKNLKTKALHRHHVDTHEAVVSLVTNGKGIMSAYGDKLTPEEIADVSSYVLQRAAENWK